MKSRKKKYIEYIYNSIIPIKCFIDWEQKAFISEYRSIESSGRNACVCIPYTLYFYEKIIILITTTSRRNVIFIYIHITNLIVKLYKRQLFIFMILNNVF